MAWTCGGFLLGATYGLGLMFIGPIVVLLGYCLVWPAKWIFFSCHSYLIVIRLIVGMRVRQPSTVTVPHSWVTIPHMIRSDFHVYKDIVHEIGIPICSGREGSGTTYMFQLALSQTPAKSIYVSLRGTTSINDIYDKIFASFGVSTTTTGNFRFFMPY